MNIEQERKLGLKYLTITLIILTWIAWIEEAKAQTVQQWAVTPSVKYDHTGSPYIQSHVEAAIEEAIWVWESRIPGLDINYVGLTLGPVERAVITYKWETLQDYLAINNNPLSKAVERTWTYLDNGLISRSVIHMNTVYFQNGIDACQMMVFSHEFGHALGINGHSSNADDLMYFAPAHCRYMPTDNDLVVLGKQPATCHSVLTRENDIYVPDLNGFLAYQGDNIWSLAYMGDNPHEQGCNRATMSPEGVITLIDVQSIGATLQAVVLVPIGDNTWSLGWAE